MEISCFIEILDTILKMNGECTAIAWPIRRKRKKNHKSWDWIGLIILFSSNYKKNSARIELILGNPCQNLLHKLKNLYMDPCCHFWIYFTHYIFMRISLRAYCYIYLPVGPRSRLDRWLIMAMQESRAQRPWRAEHKMRWPRALLTFLVQPLVQIRSYFSFFPFLYIFIIFFKFSIFFTGEAPRMQ